MIIWVAIFTKMSWVFFSDPPPTDSLTDSEDDSSGEVEVEKSTRNRVERVHDIKESKRKKKRASDIIEDSEGNQSYLLCSFYV